MRFSPGKTLIAFLFMVTTSLFLAGCGNKPPAKLHVSGTPKSSLNAEQTDLVMLLLHDYFSLKDALVSGHASQANTAAKAMRLRLQTLQEAMIRDKQSNIDFVNPLASATIMLQQNLDKLIAAKDESCEIQRIHFSPLSDALYLVVRVLKVSNVTMYHTLCPMALNERGARWLSQFPEVRNPYFGDKMLFCGVLIDTLK